MTASGFLSNLSFSDEGGGSGSAAPHGRSSFVLAHANPRPRTAPPLFSFKSIMIMIKEAVSSKLYHWVYDIHSMCLFETKQNDKKGPSHGEASRSSRTAVH